jgi:hypothetical protein
MIFGHAASLCGRFRADAVAVGALAGGAALSRLSQLEKPCNQYRKLRWMRNTAPRESRFDAA